MSIPVLIEPCHCPIDATLLEARGLPVQQELSFTVLSVYPCRVRVRIRNDADRCRSSLIELSGDLDTYTTVRIEPTIGEVLDTEPESIDIDLSRVTFIDGRGVRFLLRIHRSIARSGAEMRLVSPAPCVRRLVRLLELDDTFDIVGRARCRHVDPVPRGAVTSLGER